MPTLNLDFAHPTIQAAIVGALGVLISALTSMYVARRNIHKDARSRARIEWMTAVRTNVPEVVAAIDLVRRAIIQGDELQIISRNGDLLRAQLRLRLLLSNDAEHRKLEALLQTCVTSVLKQGLVYDPEADLALILAQTKVVLQNEWSLASHGK